MTKLYSIFFLALIGATTTGSVFAKKIFTLDPPRHFYDSETFRAGGNDMIHDVCPGCAVRNATRFFSDETLQG